MFVGGADAPDRALFPAVAWGAAAPVDDRRIISGIIFVIRNGLRWRDAPRGYGPHKTIYNRFVRWSRMGVFNRIFANLAASSDADDVLMIMPRISKRIVALPAF